MFLLYAKISESASKMIRTRQKYGSQMEFNDTYNINLNDKTFVPLF